MVQEYNKSIAIIGAGASGCVCAYYLLKAGVDVTIFDFGKPLRTILPTGGGRCNLAHAEYDYKDLAKNYPRGEKFLYSVFSRFGTYETIDLFEEIGIKTYTQENNRIFPESNSAVDVRNKLLNKINNANIINEKVKDIITLNNNYKIKTDKAEYLFDKVVLAIGGKNSLSLAINLNINTISQKPSLVGLSTSEHFKEISGVVIKNVLSKDLKDTDDVLFTHFGISGPLTYKISSINARKDFPYNLNFDLYPYEFNLQNDLNNNPHKELKNILSQYLPINFVKYILGDLAEIKAHTVDGKTRDSILEKVHDFKVEVIGTNKGEETVTAGGIDLKEINPKTMEFYNHKNLYAIGEVLDIDGFCGGFNLQNAWSTAYVASQSILSN